MPRIVMSDDQSFKQFVERFVAAPKYTAYVTDDDEIVLEPLRSTSPIRYGYVACATPSQCSRLAAYLREKGVAILKCERYEWATDRMVGASASAVADSFETGG